jgi:hypothetical protein
MQTIIITSEDWKLVVKAARSLVKFSLNKAELEGQRFETAAKFIIKSSDKKSEIEFGHSWPNEEYRAIVKLG